MTTLFVYIVVGLGAGLILIGLAKVVMAGLLQRENDYYRDLYDDIETDAAPAGSAENGGGVHHD